MISDRHFYHRTIRKNVVVFGTIFNDITLVRYKKNTLDEVERFKVPLSYAGKENFVNRLFANPNLERTIQIKLPRMSFEMISMNYDASRKLSSFNHKQQAGPDGDTLLSIPSPVPYNLTFDLNIYVRNVEDGTQIVEQILPYFNPDYTLTMNFIDGMDVKRDVPVILDDIQYSPDYQGPDITPRYLIWTLRFTMKTFFYGYVNPAGRKIIRRSVANTYNINDNTQYIYQAVVPDPIDANIDDDYGFTDILQEQPNVGNFDVADSTILTADSKNLSADDNDG